MFHQQLLSVGSKIIYDRIWRIQAEFINYEM